jgi:hypothetical protein
MKMRSSCRLRWRQARPSASSPRHPASFLLQRSFSQEAQLFDDAPIRQNDLLTRSRPSLSCCRELQPSKASIAGSALALTSLSQDCLAPTSAHAAPITCRPLSSRILARSHTQAQRTPPQLRLRARSCPLQVVVASIPQRVAATPAVPRLVDRSSIGVQEA